MRFLLKKWPRNVPERQAYVDPIFAQIARRYDLMGRLLSLGQGQRWKRKSVAMIGGGNVRTVLDLASGTGDFPLHLRKSGLGAPIFGLDRNPAMLEVAREKCAHLKQIAFVHGDLMQIPFRSRSFDAVTVGYGLRYPADIRPILTEIFRLLRSGGILVALDFGVPRNRFYRGICFGYLLWIGSVLGFLLHRKWDTYWHIVESLRVYPGQETVEKWLREAGFADVRMRELLGGIIVIHAATKP